MKRITQENLAKILEEKIREAVTAANSLVNAPRNSPYSDTTYWGLEAKELHRNLESLSRRARILIDSLELARQRGGGI